MLNGCIAYPHVKVEWWGQKSNNGMHPTANSSDVIRKT